MNKPVHLICNGEKWACTSAEDHGSYIQYSITAPSVTDGISTKEVKRRLKSLRTITERQKDD